MRPNYKAINKYILDCIDGGNYGVTLKSDKEKITFLMKVINNEMHGQNKIVDYLQGLGSACNIAYTNYDILQLAKQWGSLPKNPTEKQEDKILDNYWNFMATQIQKLSNKHRT